MTLEAALTSPTYSIDIDPAAKTVTLCVLCPGKVLKNDGMVKDHLASTVRHPAYHLALLPFITVPQTQQVRGKGKVPMAC